MTSIPTVSEQIARRIPWVTTEQMVEVDRAMIQDYGIVLLQMMEHAGRHLAHLARERFFGGQARGRTAIVLAGTGGNGGGALVCARRLASWGATVSVFTTALEGRFAEIPQHQLRILGKLGVEVHPARIPSRSEPTLIVDGIIGYSLRGAPRGLAAELIHWANESPAPVLALDVPSGLDATSGTAADPPSRPPPR